MQKSLRIVLAVLFAVFQRDTWAADVHRLEVLLGFDAPPRAPLRAGVVHHAGNSYFGASEGGESNCGAIMSTSYLPSYINQAAPLFHFTGLAGERPGNVPSGSLLVVGDWLWGTTVKGGVGDAGTVFKYHLITGEFVCVMQFGAHEAGSAGYLGVNPEWGLATVDGSEVWGYTSSSPGRIFKVSTATNEAVPVATIHEAVITSEQSLVGELVFDGVDSLWACSRTGGANGLGSVFKVAPSTGNVTRVVDFSGDGPSAPGQSPQVGLVFHAGSLWGVCQPGPALAPTVRAQVFRVNPATSSYQVWSSLAKFQQHRDDTIVSVQIVSGADGKLAVQVYGEQSQYQVNTIIGTQETGTDSLTAQYVPLWTGGLGKGVQRISRGASAVIPSLVTCLAGGLGGNGGLRYADLRYYTRTFVSLGNNLTGRAPSGTLYSLPDGRLAGLTKNGGYYGQGAAYRISPADKSVQFATSPNVLYEGLVGEVWPNSSGGWSAFAARGGGGGTGGIVHISQYGSEWNYNTLSSNVPGLPITAANPTMGAVGTSESPFTLAFAAGNAVHQLFSHSGSVSTKGSFTGNSGPLPGAGPFGKLTPSSGNSHWGVTWGGGATGFGTVYGIYAEPLRPWTISSILTFTGSTGAFPGANPVGTLVETSDRTLWGVTAAGGSQGKGLVYRLNFSPTRLAVVMEFSPTSVPGIGHSPKAGLVDDKKGYLWGTTSKGGNHDAGTIYRIKIETNQAEVMYHLNGLADGPYPVSSPEVPLMLHTDGNLYGTTQGVGRHTNGDLAAGGGVYRIQLGHRLVVEDVTSGSALLDGGSLDFGASYMPRPKVKKRMIRLTNPNSITLRGLQAKLTPIAPSKAGQFSFLPALPSTLAAGSVFVTTLSFKPNSLGEQKARFSVTGTDVDGIDLNISGNSTEQSISVGAYPGYEEGTRATFEIKLTGPATEDMLIPFSFTSSVPGQCRLLTPSPVKIPAGEYTAFVVVESKHDYRPEPNLRVRLRLGSLARLSANPGEQSSAEILFQDNDVKPYYLSNEDAGTGPQLLIAGMSWHLYPPLINDGFVPLSGQWLKDGNRVVGHGMTLPISSATMDHAGTYKHRVKSSSGKTKTSEPFPVWVVDVAPNIVAVKRGASCVLSVADRIAGPDLHYQWRKVSPTGTTDLQNGLSFNSATTPKLQIRSATESGDYECLITQGSAREMLDRLHVRLEVVSRNPVLLPISFPTAIVHQPFEYMIPQSTEADRTAQHVKVEGLPHGLTCNSRTGFITGRPTQIGSFPVSITARNAHGSATATSTMIIQTLPEAITGEYDCLVDYNHFVNDGVTSHGATRLPARIQYLVSSSGVLTGRATFGTEIYPFTALVSNAFYTAPDEYAASTSIYVKDVGHVSLLMIASSGSPAVVLSLFSQDYYGVVVHKARTLPLLRGRTYNMVLDADGDGSGYGFGTVTSQGVFNVVGRLPDGSAITTSGPIGDNLWALGRDQQGDSKKGFSFFARFELPAEPDGLVTIVDGSATWNGSLSGISGVYGSQYVPPAAGESVWGLPQTGTDNAKMTFSWPTNDQYGTSFNDEWGVRLEPDSALINPVNATARIKPKRLVIDKVKGTFSGQLVIDEGTSHARQATYQGILLSSQRYGRGFYIVPNNVSPIVYPSGSTYPTPTVSRSVTLQPPVTSDPP
jgi:uncharacterized repeat protein (TIGR03803 family)